MRRIREEYNPGSLSGLRTLVVAAGAGLVSYLLFKEVPNQEKFHPIANIYSRWIVAFGGAALGAALDMSIARGVYSIKKRLRRNRRLAN